MKHSFECWIKSVFLICMALLADLSDARLGADLILPTRGAQALGSCHRASSFWSSNVNSFWKRQCAQHTASSKLAQQHALVLLNNQCQRRILVRRHLLDFFDPLEPLELLWEFYVNRYEILDELVANVAHFARKKSLRAGVYFVSALVAAEILARLGALGGGGRRQRSSSLVQSLRSSKRVSEGLEERFYQKTSSWMLHHAVGVFSKFRHLGNKSKFAISVSAGGLFGKVAIKTTVLTVKTVLISFFVMETASFLGIIGEPGESLLDWVDDQVESDAAWTLHLARWHKAARLHCNLQVLENLYEACVDEEKIASFGFSVGTVCALLTT